MATYSKTLNPTDYAVFHETRHIENIQRIVGGGMPHPHRRWEYGIVLNALRQPGIKIKTVLDVGGGGSLFAPAAAWPDVGFDVTEVDPADCRPTVLGQSQRIGRPIACHCCDFMAYDGPKDFDAVAAISVLEHIPDDFAFYRKLASHVRVGGILALTVDFWPDAAPKSAYHLRTYTERRLRDLLESVPQLESLGAFDYADRGAHVFSYTFASLIAKRVS
jgi:2-polyprenyl-3-methyl-5-hydroxy-6-metoxy-1,4-benzoquinol methylase